MTASTARDSALPPIVADDRPLKRLGLVIVLTVFGGLGGWAALAPLGSASLAPGIVTVESYRKTVQHLEGGIVKQILARDGDRVEKDQTLVILDDTQARAQLEVLRGQYFLSLAREARLVAEQADAGRIEFPRTLLDQRGDPRVAEAIKLQEQLFRVRKVSREGEIAVLEQTIQQLTSKIAGLQALKTSREQLLDSYRGELEDYKALLQQGFADKQHVRELERRVAQVEGERAEYLSEIATSQVQIGEARLKILQLKKDFQAQVTDELTKVQADLFDLQERMQSLRDTVERTVIKAPESGMVLGLSVHTIGGVIKPGEPLLDIVPKGEKLIIEAEVPPLDIDRVHPGLKADVRLSVFKSATTPRVEGEVLSVSADRLVNERTGAAYYLARVALTEEGQRKLRESHHELVPGMPVEVLINTGQRTMLAYLLQPLSNAFARSFIED
ncbi:HlyD family type I secretion periplasmic adaptor subunit [Candidatus Methylocalor cossyra]|uniref:Membrane fusion protein (MFP) family protein n=1 Tax=Candidatus Methylocalor cossyra TaxID=3108543 RepID=A0ABM9NJL1_9GAMM